MKMQQITESIQNILELGPPFFKNDTWLQQDGIARKYFKEIKEEVDEAIEEFKKDNAVHLEDELGDIFWDYVMLLQVLKRDGYIRSIENVFTHAEEKFTDRLGFVHLDKKVNSEDYWNDVKKKQKIQLKRDHEELYGK